MGERSSGARHRAALVFYHRDGVKVVPLAAEGSLIVGRAYPADVVVADPSLSRRHARFTWDASGVLVEDLGSTNGSTVNGQPTKDQTTVGPNDAVGLGEVAVSLNVLVPRGTEPPALESYDRFHALLETEVTRARTFARPLSLVMVQAEGAERLRHLLRPVDSVGIYSTGAVLALLPEVDRGGARLVADTILGGRATGEPELRAAIAVLPDDGTSAELLLAAACRALRPAGDRASEATEASGIVCASAAMRELLESARRVATAALPVLLQGETGSGKEVLARAIHQASRRHDKPLKCINCAAIPATLLESTLFGHEKGAFTGAERSQKGVFELANGGTVLLDEVG